MISQQLYSLADYRGGRGIDCSLKDGNFISALSTTVVMSNNKWLSPVSAYENTVQSDSILFPNPASGHVTVKIPMMEGVPVQSSITDITGKQYQVHSTQSWEQGIRTAVFNVGILPAGKYFLRMEGSTGIYIFAFMKE